MNLVLLAALVAVCGAAKLDRTYLPPASAKSAGGSSGSLQTPFAGNSFNHRLGPKGSFTNEFQGVVVDAAAAGTRASKNETGLGELRQSYGSINSKVGDAAFRGNAGFRQDDNRPSGTVGSQDFDVQAASKAVQGSGLSQGYETNAQRFESKPERSQAPYDRVANTLRFENEIGTDSYLYSFETDNGISAEEKAVATNGVQAQGGYSYTGDDGQVYSVTYTADEGGYQPRGDHLPTPPPIPEEILKALEKNARDEAAGLNDDGSYDAQKYNAGADYVESDVTNVAQNDRQTPNFGKRPEYDTTASGTFINQNNQAFVRPGPNELFAQGDESTDVRDTSINAFSPSKPSDGITQASQSNRFQSNRFGSRNEYLPPVNSFQNNGRPQRPIASSIGNNKQGNIPQSNEGFDSDNQSTRPQGSQSALPLGGSNRNTLNRPSQNSLNNYERPTPNNVFEPSQSTPGSAAVGQFSQTTGNGFGSRNEYLPPVRGQTSRPQRPVYSAVNTVDINLPSRTTENFQTASQVQPSSGFSQDLDSGANAGVQANQQFNRFQQKPQNTNRFPEQSDFVTDDKPSSTSSFDAQHPTSLPSIELTTPLESNESSDRDLVSSTTFNSQSSYVRPVGPDLSQLEKNKVQSSRPLSIAQPQGFNSFPIQEQNQYQPTSENKPSQASQSSLIQNQPEDAQFSPSTVRPLNNQPIQGVDDSYYYRQPARPFNTPTSPKFPSAPSGQFNGVSQQAQPGPQLSGSSQQNIPVSSFQSQRGPNRGTTRYPEPPTLAAATPTASIEGQFQESTSSFQYNDITQASASPFRPQNVQASTKYPRPPTLAPTAPTTSLGGFPSQYNGITQASASAFASGAPTVPSNFNTPSSTFGSRPSFQSQYNQQNQFQSSPTQFGQRQPQDTSSNKNQEDEAPSTPPQQYSGEIYEYNKPSESLPAPAKPESTPSPQRGQPQSQFGENQDKSNAQEVIAQQPTRPSFSARPQYEPRPTQSQFSQSSVSNTEDQPAQDSKPQYNVRPLHFEQEQSQAAQVSARPQFGAQNNGRPNKCCQSLDAQITKLENQRPAQVNNRGPTRPQFVESEAQFSGPTSQGSAQSFAGRGEVFGGPRKPPSFNQETGYHY